MNCYSTVVKIEPMTQQRVTGLFESMETLEQTVEEEVQIPSDLNQGEKIVVITEKILK